MTEKEPRTTPVDWERIEADYRAGILSVREIAARRGVSHTAIQKRAKRFDWPRDLAAQIHAKADALVVAASVASANRSGDLETILVNGAAEASVRIAHKASIARLQDYGDTLMAELEACTDDLMKRANTFKVLVDTRKATIAMQREAFGMTTEDDREQKPLGARSLAIEFVDARVRVVDEAAS